MSSTYKLNKVMRGRNYLYNQIASVVKEHPYDIDTKSVLDEVDCDSNMTVKKYVDQLVEDGKLKRTRKVCHTIMYDTTDEDEEDE